MSALTKKIQYCGQHSDCDGYCTGDKEVFTISHKEAQKAIDEVKKACIEAAMNSGMTQDQYEFIRVTVVPAIEGVE